MIAAKSAVALIVSISILLASHDVSAQTGATLVAIVTSEPNASLTRRVRAELEGLGVDVIVLKPPAEASTLRAPLEQAARNVGAIAAVRIVASSQGKIEVWVVDRVTGKTVVRELDAGGTGASEASVAVGTVELLRASLMELHASEPPHGEVHTTPKLEALALPMAPPPPAIPRLGLAVSGGAELGLRGIGPSMEAGLGVWWRLTPRFGIRAIGDTTLAPAHVVTSLGSVDVRSQLFGATLVYDLADPRKSWVPELSLGITGAHVTATGTATSPFVGTNASAWYAAPVAGLGLGWAFVRNLRLRADGLAAWAFPAAHLRTPTSEVGRWGAPAVMLTLGIEVLWSP